VHALDLLAGTKRITILAGAGVEHDSAAGELRAAAERWSIPVATTLRAKGVFPEDHELSLGVFGYAGTRHATAALLDPELEFLLILGSGLNERDTMHWTLRQRSKSRRIHVNTDMWEITSHGKPDHAVSGSCRAFLELLGNAAGAPAAGLSEGAAERQSFIAKVKAGPRFYDIENCQRPTKPIHPAAAIAALRAVFRATALCSSIPARIGLLPAIIGRHTSRAPISRPPISDRWAGPFPPPSACSAHSPSGASP
jgi:acetolactate synthase I/II/III large subunit